MTFHFESNNQLQPTLPRRGKLGASCGVQAPPLGPCGSGKAIAEDSHDALKQGSVWVWSQGCIEQVTGASDKGEDAIIEQEQRLREMSAADIEQQMPAFKACFDWIRSI